MITITYHPLQSDLDRIAELHAIRARTGFEPRTDEDLLADVVYLGLIRELETMRLVEEYRKSKEAECDQLT